MFTHAYMYLCNCLYRSTHDRRLTVTEETLTSETAAPK